MIGTKIVKIVKIDLEMSQKNKSKFFISNRFCVSYCHLNKDPCFLDTLNVDLKYLYQNQLIFF